MQKIEAHFQSGPWLPVDKIKRSFVKHVLSEPSPGKAWHYPSKRTSTKLSVIIPTIDANRNGYFLNLLNQISNQNLKNFEIIVVRGDPSQGRGINTAAALARGKYLLILDDDTSLPDPGTFRKLIKIMEGHKEIGIAGGNNTVPQDAPPFIRQVMKQIPRRSWPAVSEITISDLAEHPCMIMRTEEFKKVGGENELIFRGLDPYLREEFRKLGKLVVVVPGVIYHHLPPDKIGKLFRQFYRNGYQAFFANHIYPQWVIETPHKHGSFRPRRPFPFRFLRFSKILFQSLITFKLIWFVCEIAYAIGFLSGMVIIKKKS